MTCWTRWAAPEGLLGGPAAAGGGVAALPAFHKSGARLAGQPSERVMLLGRCALFSPAVNVDRNYLLFWMPIWLQLGLAGTSGTALVAFATCFAARGLVSTSGLGGQSNLHTRTRVVRAGASPEDGLGLAHAPFTCSQDATRGPLTRKRCTRWWRQEAANPLETGCRVLTGPLPTCGREDERAPVELCSTFPALPVGSVLDGKPGACRLRKG